MDVIEYLRSRLYDYQLEALFAVITYFEENNGNPLICLPTATGKSFVNAAIALYVLATYPNQKILFLTHVKNLIEQNLEKVLQLWPNAPAGVFSAGLNQRDTAHPLLFAGIASIVKNLELFYWFDLIVIDEAHLVSLNEDSMYQTTIAYFASINPNIKVIGLTATEYRMQQGRLTEGKGAVFTDTCIDLTKPAPFRRFIAEGRLAPLIPTQTRIEVDTSGIKIMNGDFANNQLNEATEKILYEALKETCEKAWNRNCWVVFCSGIKPSEHAAEILNSFGIPTAAIHSKLSDEECDKRFAAFKRGELKAIVGNNKFTTGFDFPPIDLIVMLRSTMSPGLWVQMLGRGTRVYDCNKPSQYKVGFDYVKGNCLVLDFAGNCRRLGPINDPVIPKKKGEKVGEAPIKICEAIHDGVKCGIYNHASARHCGGHPYPSDEGCGAEFTFKTKLVTTAGTEALIAGEVPTEEIKEVTRVIYHKHTKIGSEPSIKVSYYSGLQKYTEWVCPQHKGFALTRFRNWWRQRHASEPPTNTDEALLYVSQLRVPKRIKVMKTGQYYEVTGVEWD